MLSRRRGAAESRSTRHARPTTVGRTLRAATQFDRSAVDLLSGLIAAVPLTAAFGSAVALGQPVAAATLTAGAMLVAIAWRVRGGQPPTALLALDAAVMALATLLGSVTGNMPALHLAVVFVWALGAGLLVAIGPQAAVLGTQGVIAVVVFGRFGQSLPGALQLAGLVLAGGLATTLFAAIVRWPTPLRARRRSVAAACEALAKLATAPPGVSMVALATQLDEARAALSSSVLLGDSSLLALRGLVDEAARLRVELRALQVQLSPELARRVQPLRERVASTLAVIAASIDGDAPARGALAQAAAGSFDLDPPPGEVGPLDPAVSRRFAAIAGQLRAMTRLCEQARPGRLRDRRPRVGGARIRGQLRSDLERVRANATLSSPAGRHAVRLAVVVLVSGLLARVAPLERSYWIVVAAATVLRPDFAATFTRGAERVLGTIVGVGLASVIAISLHPSLGAVVPILAVLAWLAFAVFPASFALGFAFVTALVVFLLDAVTAHTIATAGDRLMDTLIGGALGLLAYALWPTWSGGSAREALVDAVESQRAYLATTLSLLGGRERAGAGSSAGSGAVADASRRARRSYAVAEEAIARALAEPASRRAGAERSRSALLALHRVGGVVHLLRVEAEALGGDAPPLALTPLAEAFDARLKASAAALARTRAPAVPASETAGETAAELRERYRELSRTRPATGAGEPLLEQLDELVDAVNSLAAVAVDRTS